MTGFVGVKGCDRFCWSEGVVTSLASPVVAFLVFFGFVVLVIDCDFLSFAHSL